MDQPLPVRPFQWRVLAVLCAEVLLVAMDNTIVNVALPTLDSQFSTSTSDLQWVVDSYTVFFAGLLLVFGNIGDRIGRKRILQVGLVLFGLPRSPRATPRRSGSSSRPARPWAWPSP